MNRIHSQNGGALIVGLAMLLVMTVIGAAGMQATALEEKMAGNARNRDLAFQAAEAALRAGEAWLRTAPQENGAVVCTATVQGGLDNSGCYAASADPTPIWKTIDDANAWGEPGMAVPYAGSLAQVTEQPSYIVEQLQFLDDADQGGLEAGKQPVQKHFYRITAHGYGGTTDAAAIVQSTYRIN
jgi:type IV pilus assembly protein PilX